MVEESVLRTRKVLLLDFDQTVAATHVWKLLNGKKDPTLLEGIEDERLWGSQARLRLIQRWWADMRDAGVDVHIVSHNWAPIVEAALQRASLPAASISGRETVRQKGVAVTRILARTRTPPSHACFADDDPANILNVSQACPGISTLLCPVQGLQQPEIDTLMRWCHEQR
eukprot:TRINITY_DN66987_c0_g1_i1.p1 TRINITY_DN66987_c0_g1~~TRINITY_DN66987_c0_g1_i1.p1  ORF type:complete len:170 (+),score=21.52 TRINITY_DN66987_c0_g1_i1:136-645(+)